MGSTLMESSKGSSKKIPKKRRGLRINMPDFGDFTAPKVETSGSTKSGTQTGERLIRSASPTKGDTAKNPASRPSTPHSAPVPSKAISASPKTIFPYPSHQNASPKSPRRLSFSGIFRSNSTSTSMKIFSRTRREGQFGRSWWNSSAQAKSYHARLPLENGIDHEHPHSKMLPPPCFTREMIC
ncbi:hypothetical protein ATANTOWER_011051 [Ataeniobius toweri]|uniref:Uncharacterized protein n=1 Tax=Ataeniobius toweri TaxID=208326 RepID=A0ABU7AGC5_9TELE|nr:hypothetical protein [Ataeniobius toweri]